ncbi:MAG: hypothetical protein M1528_01500 [Candidatus Marsarchaeota archaeon]|jgi:predicted nucleic acid-binding Zn ribbon protein|nr:hypothetical protein [Candidatus Marsarchaeota archaeon]MCL5115192.1 hypothetical protein [Candidatus Marsarchaeota archaeon]
MVDEINFLDLVSLSSITPNLVVEKFGGKINSSFFDGSNILGSLRLKGLVDFTANFPGQSVITVTDAGKQLLSDAEEKAKTPFDAVDFAILTQLQSGKRSYVDLGGAVNLRPIDLALHLYKMGKQQYIIYEIKNGNVDIMLTEKGLMQAKTGMPAPQPQANQPAGSAPAAGVDQQVAMPPMPPPPPAPNVQVVQSATPGQEQQATNQQDRVLAEIEEKVRKERKKRQLMMIVLACVAVIIIVIVLLFTRIV